MTNHPPDAQEISSEIQRVNRLGTASEKLFSRLYKGLGRRSKAAQLMEEQNRKFERMLVQRDVEVERLNSILASIDEGVIMQDNEGRLVFMNNAARVLLGGIKSFWQSELGTLFNNFREIVALDAEVSPLSEPTRVQVNNRIIGAQLAAVADEAGNRLGTIIVVRDVTRDVLSERLKDQFITAISHELRTPMAVIKGVSEVVLEQADEGKPNRRLLETLSRNVDILDRMIIELLDLSELSSDSIEVRDDDLSLEELLWNTVNGMHPETKRAGLDVSVMVRDASALSIQGDAPRLRWALGHLLQNSIRYTESGGHIVLTASRSDDEHIAIQVVDTGVGISERDLPHIFERFYRGEARTPSGKLLDPRGLGQGLFIAQKVAEAHGGYLTVRSQPGQGSIFTLVLPVAA
jgi:two-component system phosphate regulon sensor histidine kinase PhoR